MLLYILLTFIAGTSAVIYCAYKIMNPIRFQGIVGWIMYYSGCLQFLQKTGLMKFMRPSDYSYLESPEGARIPVCGIPQCMTTEVSQFQVRDDDIFISTYPKSGTTWTQEIVWLLCNNTNVQAAKEEIITSRVPFLETSGMGSKYAGILELKAWPNHKQRIMKTHLPYQFLPYDLRKGRKCKIIYVARNAKDVCVSYYYMHKMTTMMNDPGTWSQFLTNYCAGKVVFGSWFSHVLGYWEKYQENDERIHFTTYERMKKDLKAEVFLISKFLGKKLSDMQLNAVTEHCSFESMSKNPSTNYSDASKLGMDFSKAKFMRKGQVGDWKNHFTLNENSAFDVLYESEMKGKGLDIPFEI